MLEHLRAPFKKLIEPIAKALIAIGLTANAVTVIGAVGTIVVAIATGVTGWLFGGAVVLTLLVLADSLDGSIAALTTGGTEFGAFLDSTLDRIADWAMLVGVIIFFLMHRDWWHTAIDNTPDYTSMIGIAAAHTCCDFDVLNQLGEELAALRVDGGLLVLGGPTWNDLT